MNCARFWTLLDKKSTYEYFVSASEYFMVPRDRIELPTRGFSDQICENSKMF